jgi:hypothetical protein
VTRAIAATQQLVSFCDAIKFTSSVKTSLFPHRFLESGISSLCLFICEPFPFLCRRYGGFGAGRCLIGLKPGRIG